MRAVIQRVSEASVSINNETCSSMGRGLLVFIGVGLDDSEADADKLASKISKLRVFSDENGLMNLSASDVNGQFLVVSQFTLHADTKKGNRPSYIKAAKPETAVPLYEYFVKKLSEESGLQVRTGEFGADMKVSLLNDGPVTIWIDTKNWE